jgi:uncharacterized protein with FMN-binding domain
MKKYYVIAGVLVVAVIIYFVSTNENNAPVAVTPTPVVAPTSTTDGSTSTPTGSTGGSTPHSTTPPTATPPAASGYKDGTYTGPVSGASLYGNLQVAVTITGGKITNVTFPQYPNEPGHTTDVSNSALPQLKQEAIAAQASNVNTVSGATQDTEAFNESLTGALAQAQS